MLRRIGSLRLSVVLLSVIAGIATVGTLITQGAPEEFYTARYGQGIGRLILLIGADRVYSSLLFVAACCLLSVNLGACVIRSAKIHLAVGGSKRLLVGLHVGLLLLGSGAGISAWQRRVVFYQLMPGQQLPFPEVNITVEMKEFEIEFYPQSDQPREYRTTVMIHTPGRDPLQRIIRVNHPVTVGGHTLYQASFEALGSIQLRVRQADEVVWHGNISAGESVVLPGPDSLTLTLEKVIPDAVVVPGHGVRSRSFRLQNPAVHVGIYRQQDLLERHWWNADGLMEEAVPQFAVELEQADFVYATILKTVKDPGFPLVAAGFGLICIAGIGYLWRREQESVPAAQDRGVPWGV